jgi:uncharacterized membrane protein
MNCPSCNAEVNPGSTFCSSCGAALSAPTGGAAAATLPSQPAGLTDNAAGAIAYLTIVPAILFLILEPYNRSLFVKFHSFQCIFLSVAAFAAYLIAAFIPVLGLVIAPLLGLFFFVVWIITILKASKGEWFKLPVIGGLAEQQARRP